MLNLRNPEYSEILWGPLSCHSKRGAPWNSVDRALEPVESHNNNVLVGRSCRGCVDIGQAQKALVRKPIGVWLDLGLRSVENVMANDSRATVANLC